MQVAAAARDAIRKLDPALPLDRMVTQEEQIARSISRERLFARLSMSLGSITLLLAAIGLYALLAYSVARRAPEIGIRMALGADRRMVRLMVLRQSLVLVTAGLVLGLPAAYWGTALVRTMLFELSPRDPLTFGAAAVVLLATSLAAAYIPARNASRVDPLIALRSE
jgi:ABC-type antimicrobial peptide transport system permease subunit